MNLIRQFGTILGFLCLASCAPPTQYKWGDYSQSMYDYSRDENQAEQYVAALKAVIKSNEEAGKRVPPGIYAEYGYMLMSVGETTEAVGFFEKEKQLWPESGKFMDTMIKYGTNGGRPGNVLLAFGTDEK